MHGSAENPQFDIIDTARNESSFAIFLGALKSVGFLVDHLKGAGPFTVFMPTDQAFDSLPSGTIQNLEKPDNVNKLDQLLRRHIVRGSHPSAEVRTMLNLTAETGDLLNIESDSRGVRILNAPVLGREILCTNGVIHAIGAVLMP